jgi:hypothetical protein
MKLEPTILAKYPTRTGTYIALCGHTAIDAALTAVEGLQRISLLILLCTGPLTITNQELVSFLFTQDVLLALKVLVLLNGGKHGHGIGKLSQSLRVILEFLLPLAKH